jgi:hypothetical protein
MAATNHTRPRTTRAPACPTSADRPAGRGGAHGATASRTVPTPRETTSGPGNSSVQGEPQTLTSARAQRSPAQGESWLLNRLVQAKRAYATCRTVQAALHAQNAERDRDFASCLASGALYALAGLIDGLETALQSIPAARSADGTSVSLINEIFSANPAHDKTASDNSPESALLQLGAGMQPLETAYATCVTVQHALRGGRPLIDPAFARALECGVADPLLALLTAALSSPSVTPAAPAGRASPETANAGSSRRGPPAQRPQPHRNPRETATEKEGRS